MNTSILPTSQVHQRLLQAAPRMQLIAIYFNLLDGDVVFMSQVK